MFGRNNEIEKLQAELAELRTQNDQLRAANAGFAERAYVLDIVVEGRSLIVRFMRGNGDRAELLSYAPMGFNVKDWRKWLTST